MKIKRFSITLAKIIFCVICYIITLLFAVCSGAFTVIFYAEGQTNETVKMLTGLLAALFEVVKFVLAITYPFMLYRNLEIEKRVKRILNVALLLSILASLNFFLSATDINRSPASKITELLYSYVEFLNVIPIGFVKFITTMSLSIIIEVLIIKIPSIAAIFFFEKNIKKSRKRNVISNWVLSIVSWI